MDFLKQIPVPVLELTVLILLVVILIMTIQNIRMKGLEGIRVDVYQLFLLAEKNIEIELGQQKMKWVIQQARGLLPSWLQVVITDAALEKMLEKWFKGIKDLLDDGKINASQE